MFEVRRVRKGQDVAGPPSDVRWRKAERCGRGTIATDHFAVPADYDDRDFKGVEDVDNVVASGEHSRLADRCLWDLMGRGFTLIRSRHWVGSFEAW
jgi:hypothetical protein